MMLFLAKIVFRQKKKFSVFDKIHVNQNGFEKKEMLLCANGCSIQNKN